ncbi:hypothetical protein DXG01_007109 [Tephrocybe rancida]|nr:hypothetical protein DXG01_007109 [Tephrocybe rancida]
MGCLDRVGIMGPDHSKLYTATLDNTSMNTTICRTVEAVHVMHSLSWNSQENQLPCLGHIVNLGTVDVMSHITKIGNVETVTAIWEFNPSLPNNCVLGGSLNVVSTIHTLTIKTQASSQ